MAKLCILYDKVRYEEKTLFEKAKEKGLEASIIDAKNITINTHSREPEQKLGDIILQRCISHYRGLYLTACLEFTEHHVINKYKVSEICGNKLSTSLVLAKNNVPTPVTHFAFSSEAATDIINKQGLPLVLKPIVGSWGRGVFPLRDPEMANMIMEMREESDSPLARIFYIQEMINRPPRDIRCIVAGDKVVTAIYRYSADKEWRTNVARGGKAEVAKITSEMEDIVIKAAKAVGGGILGIDLMEDSQKGLLVHEVNNTVEFRGASAVSQVDIAEALIDYAHSLCRK